MFQRKKKSGVNFELGGISWILRSVSMVAKLENYKQVVLRGRLSK